MVASHSIKVLPMTFLQLVLRTINSARSAYMSVTFDARFFDEYHIFNCTVVQAGLLLKVSSSASGPALW